MNERIRQLAKEAGITTNLDTDYYERDMNKWVDYFSEKFAELTVRDCIQTLVNHGYTDAASALSDAQFGPGTEWQKYQFPDI